MKSEREIITSSQNKYVSLARGLTNKKNREKEKSEKKIQKAMLQIKDKYGKNAIIKGMNLEEGGTTIERNRQIGGHKE